MDKKTRNTNDLVNANVIQAYSSPFIAELRAAGYATRTISKKRSALVRFARWRQQRKSTARDLTECEISQFLAESHQGDRSALSAASRALFGFVDFLRCRNIVGTCAPTPPTPESPLLTRYGDFLRDDKGLAELSLKVYLPVAKDVLEYLRNKHRIAAVRRVNAPILRSFLFERSQGRSSECVRLLATSLRSFLRFLYAQGEIANDLTAAVPTVRRWSQPDIPRKLVPEEVDRVLNIPNRKTSTGRRDFAILLLLARLGLRSSEILSLELGDIRWRTGEILIRGKGSRQDLLPLPRDVGSAISSYLRLDRGVRTTRRVFLRTIAPRVPLSGPASVGHIVRYSMAKAEVERPRQIAAHIFRHTLASRMLQKGAHLREISQVLRHRSHNSTEVYAKIDMNALREVVRPWPTNRGAR